MSTVQKERKLTLALKNRFDYAHKFDKIYVFKRPFQSPRLKRRWNELYRPKNITRGLVPPLQPEIDMILCKESEMNAVEIKYFEMKGNSLTRSFYHGIEQSLALLRWGFDHVALWQMFEATIRPELLYYYGAWTWRLCHAQAGGCGLGLPIDFTIRQPQKRGEEYDFPAFNVNEDRDTTYSTVGADYSN